MMISNRNVKNAFDFSKDAEGFRKRLWEQLKMHAGLSSCEELEDEDLAWVNAAGTPHVQPDAEEPVH